MSIEPIYNRTGWYHNNFINLTWFEHNGKAWRESSFNAFMDKMEYLDHRPLTNREISAMKTLINTGRKGEFENLKSLLYQDYVWKETRKLKQINRKWVRRLSSKPKKSGLELSEK
jgi:hypothetical protein